jgi:hypothetical protein
MCSYRFSLILHPVKLSKATVCKSQCQRAGLQVPVSKGLPVHESFHRPYVETSRVPRLRPRERAGLYQDMSRPNTSLGPSINRWARPGVTGTRHLPQKPQKRHQDHRLPLQGPCQPARTLTSASSPWPLKRPRARLLASPGSGAAEDDIALRGPPSSTAREKRNRHSPGDRPFRPMVFFLGGMMLRQVRDALKSRKSTGRQGVLYAWQTALPRSD